MALWQGTTLNTNNLSSAINKWWSKNFIPMVVKNNGLLYAMKGKEGAPTSPSVGSRFEKHNAITGNAINVRLLGELETFTGIADASQADADTLANNSNFLGAATFEWSHFFKNEVFVESEMRLIRGDEAKTASFMQDKLQKLVFSWEATVGNGINSADAPARTTIGGWRYAVDDSATYDAYGTITRSDSGNADFRSYVMTQSELTLEHVDDCILEIIKAGGRPDVGVGGKTPYKKLMQELRGYTVYSSEMWDKFNTLPKIGYSGVMFVYDHRGSDTDLGILTASSWSMYEDADGISQNGLVPTYDRKGATHVLPLNMWLQFICRCPSHNAKIMGIES